MPAGYDPAPPRSSTAGPWPSPPSACPAHLRWPSAGLVSARDPARTVLVTPDPKPRRASIPASRRYCTSRGQPAHRRPASSPPAPGPPRARPRWPPATAPRRSGRGRPPGLQLPPQGRPGQVAALLPGLHPVPGERGVVDQPDLLHPVEHRCATSSGTFCGQRLGELVPGPGLRRELPEHDGPGHLLRVGVWLPGRSRPARPAGGSASALGPTWTDPPRVPRSETSQSRSTSDGRPPRTSAGTVGSSLVPAARPVPAASGSVRPDPRLLARGPGAVQQVRTPPHRSPGRSRPGRRPADRCPSSP